MLRQTVRSGALCALMLFAAPALRAQASLFARQPGAPVARADSLRADSARKDTVRTLEGVRVVARRADVGAASAMQRLTLPATFAVSAQKAAVTVNVVDAEDAVKYVPSVFLRTRNNGDTQATVATRVWGVSSSARSLVFADGVPLTALIANNNTIGGPRWGLVSPEEIARVDVMHGPYSAAYGGSSMGAVLEITTRLPERLEGSVTQTQSAQGFDLYGTKRTFTTTQTNATVGDRFGRFAFWASGSYQDSHSQPLLYVTSPTFPAPAVTGAIPAYNKLGAKANVLGATGLLHTRMTNAKLKAAYDVTPWLRAAYTLGRWENDGDSGAETYLERATRPTFAGQSGFATGTYALLQRHTAQSLSLRTDGSREWDVEAVATRYAFDRDRQRFPTAVTAADTFGAAGRVAVLDGTGWSTLDVKGAWHRGGAAARHIVSFGAHEDRYRLENPTLGTSDWRGDTLGAVVTEGSGGTRTRALWAQDRLRIARGLHLTLGGRWESWRASEGLNQNGATRVDQPEAAQSRFSPKASLAWTPSRAWTLGASVAKAYRFATAAELYQLVSTGATFTSPDPSLKPDDVLSAELRAEVRTARGFAQLALFQDDVHDAIVSQFRPLVPGSATLYSYVSNVDRVRARGAELALGANAVKGVLDLSGSVTWLDARTLELSGRASATAPEGSAVGKYLPNIPKWRASFLGTLHPRERLAVSLAGRYSGKLFTTLDNADVRFNTYQGFSDWLVMDARAHYALDRHWSASLGVDNLLDRKYFLFHPFPQRTIVGSMKYAL
ncbi:MAG: TonB-dependent receptor [Gemmatimonadaceae bacterium]